MTAAGDAIADFYQRHPYPPPVESLDDTPGGGTRDELRRRQDHHLLWPTIPYRDDHTILVAGCGTSQAARYASRFPRATVVGIDVSQSSIDATRRLVDRHDITNLELRRLAIEDVATLGRSFDHVVCTGVVHHLADPGAGLAALRGALTPTGAMHLMVYASTGRVGVSMIQDYCRRVGVEPTADGIAGLVATLREMPTGHPMSHLLRTTPDFQHDDALADALLNPREVSYTVPELLDLVAAAGLRFSRWLRQAPYRPQCGAISQTPHAASISALPDAEQFAALELFRGTMMRHSAVVVRDDAPVPDPTIGWDDDRWLDMRPMRTSSTVLVEDNLPPGVAAVLINRAHTDRDLVMFVSAADRRAFEAIDGERTLGEIDGLTATFAQRLWWHDLIVLDAVRPHTTGRDRTR